MLMGQIQAQEESEENFLVRMLDKHPVITAGILLATSCLLASKRGRPVIMVHNAEAIILERLGKFSRVLTPGLNFKLPFIDSPREFTWTAFKKKEKYETNYRLDLRECVCSFPPQGVITKDNVRMNIDALVYYKVVNPQKAMYAIQDLPYAIEAFTQTNLRNLVGAMCLDDTLVSRDKINAELRQVLANVTNGWGVEVTRVELQEVTPPEDINKAMAGQMAAEREKRAAILRTEGLRASAILAAEGERAAAIERAEGHAKATKIQAEADAEAKIKKAASEAQAIQLIQQTGVQADQYLLAIRYFEQFGEMAKGKGNVVVVPYDGKSVANLTAIASTLNKNITAAQ